MERLKQRADFLAAATGTKVPAAGFVLQTRKRADDGPVRPRQGHEDLHDTRLEHPAAAVRRDDFA